MKLSIVATLYKSAPYVETFVMRAGVAARLLVGEDFEIILINDGSPDDSLARALALRPAHPNLAIVDLSRNFGHHKAMMAGLAQATGERVFLIDSDLEEEPEWLIGFAQQMDQEDCDVVYGVQKRRRGGIIEQVSGEIYYWIFNQMTGLNHSRNIVTARLMKRPYVDALLRHTESEVTIAGLWLITGFHQSTQTVVKHATSPTTYSFARKLDYLINATTSFSNKPLFLVFYAGLFTFLSSLAYISFLLIQVFFLAAPPPGYVSVIASIWMFSGLIILMLGIQSIYLAKVFAEVKRRPNSIIRAEYGTAAKKDA